MNLNLWEEDNLQQLNLVPSAHFLCSVVLLYHTSAAMLDIHPLSAGSRYTASNVHVQFIGLHSD